MKKVFNFHKYKKHKNSNENKILYRKKCPFKDKAKRKKKVKLIEVKNETKFKSQYTKNNINCNNINLKENTFIFNNKIRIEKIKNVPNINKYKSENILNTILRNIILLFLIFPVLSQNNKRKLESYSKITLKIIGKGYHNILNSEFKPLPDEIYLNNQSINPIDNKIYIDDGAESVNTIELRWNSLISKCEKMFSGLPTVTEIDMSYFNFSKVSDMEGMFNNCLSLSSINFSNADTRKVKNMRYMFSNNTSLTSLDLSSFNTSKVINLQGMFKDCKSLKYLNLSNFNTSSVTSLIYLFCNCESLTSLDLSNFDTSQVTYTFEMFYGCSSLSYLNLSSFNTSKVTHMHYMFYGCSSLTSLDISSFDTSSVSHMYAMFCNCQSLTSLNLYNFNTSKVTKINNMFSNCTSLISLNISNFDMSNAEYMRSMFHNCTLLTSLDLSNFVLSKVSNMVTMFKNCKSLEYINLGDFKELDTLNATQMFYGVPVNLVYCINEQGNNEILKSLTEKTCSTSDCSDDWKEKYINEERYKKKYVYEDECYEKCPQWTHEDNFICEDCHIQEFFEKICEIDKNNAEERKNLTKFIINEIMDENLNFSISYILNNTKELILDNDLEVYQITTLSYQLNNQNSNLTSINLGKCESRLKNIYGFDEDEELIIFKTEYSIEGYYIPIIEYEIFSPNGTIKLNLDFCKDLSINYYIPVNIDESELFKYNSSSEYYNDRCYPYTTEEGTDITIFDRRNEFNNNMSLCEANCEYNGYNLTTKKVKCECKIKTEFQYISDVFDKDKLFNNFINIKKITNFDVVLCYNLLFCKEGLLYNIGSYILLTIILQSIVISILFCLKGFHSLKKSMKKIVKKKLTEDNQININKNGESIFKKKYTKDQNAKKEKDEKDKKKDYKKNYTKDEILKKEKEEIFKKEKDEILKKEKDKENIIKEYKKIYSKDEILKKEKDEKDIKKEYKKKYTKDERSKKENLKSNFPPKKQRSKSFKKKKENRNLVSVVSLNSNNNFLPKQSKEDKGILTSFINKTPVNKIPGEIKVKHRDFNDSELNSLSYRRALKYDKRTYFQYYFSLIKSKQLLFFSFYPNNDYNSKLIKITLFFFSFALYYTVNALFFTDSTMHKIYEDNGTFNFIYQIPLIIYSTVVSTIIKNILTILSLTENNIKEIKNEKTFELSIKKMKKIVRYLQIKFILFFAFEFLFLILFWYYLSCFCTVYKNTQVYLIKNTSISFATSLLYPFGLNIIPCILRIPSLKSVKKDKECLYKISKIAQMI